jgi:hypothetical protein
MKAVNPLFIIDQFLAAWKDKNWKEMYKYVHPNIILELRSQKLKPHQLKMSDPELFIDECAGAARTNPGKNIVSYKIISISEFKKGDTAFWINCLINGTIKKLPVALDGLSLKVDMSKIVQGNTISKIK